MAQAPDIAATRRIKPDQVASRHRTAILLLILACLFWGISFPVSKFDAALLAINAWILELVCRQPSRKYPFSDGRIVDGTFLLARTP